MMAYGRYANTIYRFDQADVIVAIDADFLCEGPGHVRYAREFADRRRISGRDSTMNRLYVVEATPSNTGSMADHRLALRSAQCEAFARELARELGARPGAAEPPASFSREWLQAVARDLGANKGKSIVIAGEYQPAATHALAYAMNEALGNMGRTVLLTDPLEARPLDQMESLRTLVQAMNAGEVATLVILGGNPVFTAPADLQFARALERVPTRIHLGLYVDETVELCHWHVPEAHYLESWSDARAYDGTIGIVQPLDPRDTVAESQAKWLARLAAFIIFIGFNLTFFPQYLLGYLGMPRRYATYAAEFQVLNVMSSAGASILAVGYLLPLGYLIWSMRYGRDAGTNPWGAKGLEWVASTPPPEHNFAETPVVTEDAYAYPTRPVSSRPRPEVVHG